MRLNTVRRILDEVLNRPVQTAKIDAMLRREPCVDFSQKRESFVHFIELGRECHAHPSHQVAHRIRFSRLSAGIAPR